jgi:hypothetical protein
VKASLSSFNFKKGPWDIPRKRHCWRGGREEQHKNQEINKFKKKEFF